MFRDSLSTDFAVTAQSDPTGMAIATLRADPKCAYWPWSCHSHEVDCSAACSSALRHSEMDSVTDSVIASSRTTPHRSTASTSTSVSSRAQSLGNRNGSSSKTTAPPRPADDVGRGDSVRLHSETASKSMSAADSFAECLDVLCSLESLCSSSNVHSPADSKAKRITD